MSRAAHCEGKKRRVAATETRPVQTGSRRTAFELQHDGVDVSLIPDAAVGYSMASGMVQKAVVGADRVLRTGHVFNKIGTDQVAGMAARHNIPFYGAAPLFTLDLGSGVVHGVVELRWAGRGNGTGGWMPAPHGVRAAQPPLCHAPP